MESLTILLLLVVELGSVSSAVLIPRRYAITNKLQRFDLVEIRK